MPLTGTILELLTAQNPTLDLRQQPAGPVTQSNSYEQLHETDVLDWPDFTYANLEAAFGNLFSVGPVTSDAIQNLRGTPTEIKKEVHVDDLALLWNYQVCRWPLKLGAESIRSSLGAKRVDVTMQHNGQASKDRKSDSKAKAPDWCIYMRDEGTVIVWGDSKCSSKWSSNLDNLPTSLKNNWLWPFRQVLTYCVNNATRYGYILTPQEVVVLRVIEEKQTPQHHWRVQHASIPWDNAGTGNLTVNLCIWALAMMAVNDDHRPIRNIGDTLPLNQWWEDRDRNSPSGVTYVHHLSGRKMSRLPADGQVARRPTNTSLDSKRGAQEESSGRSLRRRREQ